MTISCGAALFNLRLALRCFGFRPRVEPFPDPNDPLLLARVHVAPDGEASPEEWELLAAIPHWITNRVPCADRPVSAGLLAEPAAAAMAEGACFMSLPTRRSDNRLPISSRKGTACGGPTPPFAGSWPPGCA